MEIQIDGILSLFKKVFEPSCEDQMLVEFKQHVPSANEVFSDYQLRHMFRKHMAEEGFLLDTKYPCQVYNELLDKISKSDSKFNSEGLRKILKVGLYPSSSMNAKARIAPNGVTYEIAVNEGIWWFISTFSRIISLHSVAQGAKDETPSFSLTKRLIEGLVHIFANKPEILKELSNPA